MTDVSSNEMVERVLRSLKSNSNEFQGRLHSERTRRIRRQLFMVVIFLSGLIVGALPITDRLLSGITKLSFMWLAMAIRN